MKRLKMGKRLIGGITLGMILFLTGLFSEAGEVKFLKIKQLNAQQEMGSAIMESGRLAWSDGRIQEQLGKVIRDAGPGGSIDQALLGKGISEAASFKWLAGLSQEKLGSALLNTAMIISKDAAILGKEAIQERTGAMIQADGRHGWVASEEAKAFAAAKVASLQEEEGKIIQKNARFRWAEEEVVATVGTAVLSGKVSGPIPNEVLYPFRSAVGFEGEGTLRTALVLMEAEKGTPLTRLLPEPVAPSATGVSKYSRIEWRGWGALASLLGFAWAMAMFSYTLIDLDRASAEKAKEMKKEMETVVFRKAA